MNKNKNKIVKIVCAAALVLAGFAGFIKADQTETIPCVTGQNTNSCAGVYYACAKMTNSAGAVWITPPAGTKTGTFTDASGFPSPYTSSAVVMRKSDQKTWCQTNSITFPATNSSYSMVVCITSTPPPTNGQPMTLQIQWSTNAP
jgi:hypothetical protein